MPPRSTLRFVYVDAYLVPGHRDVHRDPGEDGRERDWYRASFLRGRGVAGEKESATIRLVHCAHGAKREEGSKSD